MDSMDSTAPLAQKPSSGLWSNATSRIVFPGSMTSFVPRREEATREGAKRERDSCARSSVHSYILMPTLFNTPRVCSLCFVTACLPACLLERKCVHGMARPVLSG